MKETDGLRRWLLCWAEQQYGVSPDPPRRSMPGCAVLRQRDNRKWFALLTDVPRERLGLPGAGTVDLLEVKCSPILAGTLRQSPGILPACRMRRENWVAALLDGTVAREQLQFLLDQSFLLTASRQEQARRRGPQNWLIPANPQYYDVEQAFQRSDVIFWKQSSRVQVGDTVFLYVAAPVSAIRYQCRAVEVDLPRRTPAGMDAGGRRMRIQLQHRFRDGQLGLKVLRACGVTTVRGPRYVPEPLLRRIAAERQPWQAGGAEPAE